MTSALVTHALVPDKCCSKCGEVKSLDQFATERARKDGLSYWCKTCLSDKGRSYRERNPEKVKEALRSWHEKNAERVREKARERYHLNRDEILSARRTPEFLAYRRAWRKQNLETAREQDRRFDLGRHYGITVEAYEAMELAQEGVCAICSGTNPSGRRLAVDHDHATGAIRGLLCGRCNAGIAQFKDDPYLLRGALEYLARRR